MAGPRMPPKWKVCWYTFLDTFLSSCLKCFDKFLRVVGPIFVVFAVILISGVVYSWFTYILPVISQPNSVIWGIHIVIAVWLTFNVYWNYIKTIVTPPGEPWEDWVDHRPERDDDQIKAHEAAHPDACKRWCKKCRKPKPPRSHHCSVCKKCVLKMDHHCPWVSNCVGFKNYRTFFLFMAYLWVGCVYIMATSGPTFFRHIHHRGVPNTGHSYVVMSFVLAMSVSLAVGFLLSWHVYLIATNQTTIEWYGNRMRSDFAKKRGELWYNEWDIGWIENVSAVLGSAPDPWAVSVWFVPTLRPPHGDGTRFATRSEKHEMQTLMHVKVGE